jgi:hypothetical protein
VYDVLAWLENSALGHAMRGAGVWTYGIVNLVHITGVATLFGSVLVLDLRLLGLWRSIPLRSIKVPTLPMAKAGFVVAAISGSGLLAANATEYAGNPFILIKFPAIGLALLNIAVVHRHAAWTAPETYLPGIDTPRALRMAGALSLACWGTALAAGRMIGYW